LTSLAGEGENAVMELSDLTGEERVALAALVAAVVASDARASDEERAQLQRLVDAVGEAAWAEAANEAGARFRDEAALKAFLPAVTRQEARELIYGAVLAAALPDAVTPHESAILDWLGTEWGIAVRIEDPGTGGG
jgi:hypothetical protein